MEPETDKETIKKLKKKLAIQEKKNTEVRNQMAIQRTIFANERTLMAYLRTAITIIAGGFAAIKLSNHPYIELIGFSLIPLGLMLAVYSFYRYYQKGKLIQQQRKDFTETSHQHAELFEKGASRYSSTD